MLRADITGRK